MLIESTQLFALDRFILEAGTDQIMCVLLCKANNRAISIRAAGDQSGVALPAHIVYGRVVDVAHNRERHDTVCRIKQNLVSSGHSEDDAVRKVDQSRYFSALLVELWRLLRVEVWVELDAGRVCLKTRQHEGWLAKACLEEAVDCISVGPLRVGLGLKVVVARSWSQ